MFRIKKMLQQLMGRNSRYVMEAYYWWRYVLLYRGDNHICPCCNAELNKFLPLAPLFGETVDGVICPRCDSHPRHRLIWLYFVQERRELFENTLQVLHLAPEYCFTRLFNKMPNVQVVSADLASPFADCWADVCTLPFRNAAFDLVLCNHVLEHVVADGKAMAELCRVLKPGGLAVMQVPIATGVATTLEDAGITSPEERERYFGQHDHVRLYGNDYAGRLSKAGFSVEIKDFVGQLDEIEVNRYGLDSYEKLYLCGKVINT